MGQVAALWDEWGAEDYLGDFFVEPSDDALAGADNSLVFDPATDTRLGLRVSISPGADPSASPLTWGWTDVTAYVLYEPGIVITRGRPDEQSSAVPSTCTLTLKNYALPPFNVDGIFTPRNAAGPWFGVLGRNTPLKVELNAGFGWRTRFTGFVTAWPPRSDTSGNFKYVTVVAEGILRRLGQGNAPIRSIMSSTMPSFDQDSDGAVVTSYWPLEDAAESTQAASGLPGGTPMVTSGTISFDSVSPAAGSAAAPNVSNGMLIGTCASTTTGEWSVGFFVQCTGDCRPISWTTTGSLSWTLDVSTTAVTVTNSGGSTATFSANYADGEWHSIAVTCADDAFGGGLGFALFGDDSGDIDTGFNVTATSGQVAVVTVNPNVDAELVSVNHLVVCRTNSTPVGTAAGMNGYPGRAAARNFLLIAEYNNVVVTTDMTTYLSTEPMGAFPVGSLGETMRQCADADAAQLTERFDGILSFDSHLKRENQSVALTLDNSLFQLSPPFDPIEDDYSTRNDVTITRTNGTAARWVEENGPLGTGRVGTYDDSATLNLYTDDQPRLHASYRVAHGTVDEPRYPRVRVEFHRSAAYPLIFNWLTCDVGSRVKILHPPSDMPPDIIDQIIEGYTETLDQFRWEVELNLSPFLPYRVFRLALPTGDTDEFLGYLIPTTCVLAEELDASELGVDVTSDVLWSTTADDWSPSVPIRIGGEIMLVSAVSGASNPQTLTVTRGAMDTVAATHPNGATVEFVSPGILGL